MMAATTQSKPTKQRAFEEHVDSAQGQPPSKRQRTALACKRCRVRKIKCNGNYPSCSHCLDCQMPCEYRAWSGDREMSATGTMMLEQRLKEMENALRRLQRTPPEVADRSSTRESDQLAFAFEDISDSGYEASKLSSFRLPEISTDLEAEFYGPSSNVYFLRQILKTVDPKSFAAAQTSSGANLLDSIKPECSPPNALFRLEAVDTSPRASQDDEYILPCLSTTLHLVTLFFRHYGSMNPFLDDATFVQTHIHPLYKERRRPKASNLALLNMILAIATTSNIDVVKPVSQRIWLSGKFYQRARVLSIGDGLGCSGIEQVQTYLLMSQYLQSTDNCSHSWATYSMAVQAALRLGLHSEDPPSKHNEAERESRRRTWHLCVIMDRAFAMQFGRPCLIASQVGEAKLPANMRFGELSPSSASQTSSVEYISPEFFIEATKLYNILGNVLSSLYSRNAVQADSPQLFDILSVITRQCQDLDEWLESLPALLRDDGSDSSRGAGAATDVSNNMIKILRLRYYSVRSLIHRPILGLALSALDKSPDSASASPKRASDFAIFCRPSLEMSVESAAAIISIANSFESGKVGPGMWWTLLQIVYNAALTCFAVISIQSLDVLLRQSQSISELRHHIALAAEALLKLAPGHPVVERASEFLDRILTVCHHLDQRDTGASSNMQPLYDTLSFDANFTHPASEFIGLDNFGLMSDPFLLDL